MLSYSKSEWEQTVPIMLKSPDAIIVPQFHKDAMYMESVIKRHGGTLESVPAIASPPLDIFSAFMSSTTGKAGTRQWLIEKHFPYAVEEYPITAVDTMPLPVFVKPTIGTAGQGVRAFTDRNALRQYVDGLRNHSLRKHVDITHYASKLVFQQAITGNQVTIRS